MDNIFSKSLMVFDNQNVDLKVHIRNLSFAIRTFRAFRIYDEELNNKLFNHGVKILN
jgi:hypothetical protein